MLCQNLITAAAEIRNVEDAPRAKGNGLYYIGICKIANNFSYSLFGTSPFFMGQSTISIAIFNSFWILNTSNVGVEVHRCPFSPLHHCSYCSVVSWLPWKQKGESQPWRQLLSQEIHVQPLTKVLCLTKMQDLFMERAFILLFKTWSFSMNCTSSLHYFLTVSRISTTWLISSYFPLFSHCFPISFPYVPIFPICFYIFPIFYHRKVPYASIKLQFLVVSPCFTRHFFHFHMAKPVLFISVPGSWVRISADQVGCG